MGNLSNLYVSQSFQSLIHLGTNGVATPSLTTLQDGLGNSIGIEVNTAGDLFLSGSLTASLQQGYVWVGNASGKTTTVSTSSFGGGGTINTGSLVTTASFNSYTASTNIRLNNLESTSASVNVSITNLNASSASQQVSINSLNAATSSYVTSAITASSLVTASVSGTTMTFTKGNGTTFNVTLPTGSGGGTIDTASFATTGSNTFRGTQTIQTGNLVMGNGFTISAASGDITNLSAGNTIQFITEPPAGPGGTNDIKFINRVTGSSIIFENTQGGSGNRIDLIAGEIRLLTQAASGSNGNITIGNNVTRINAENTPILAAAVTASALLVNGNLTASLQQGYVWVGNASGVSRTVATSSFAGATFPFTGNAVITGSLAISTSADTSLRANNGTLSQYFGNTFGGNIGIFNLSNATEIGLALDGAAWGSNWSNGPLIYVNNTPGDTYDGVFGFQNKANYTDGRITALKRLDVSGSVNIQNTLTASLQQGYVWVGHWFSFNIRFSN